MVQYRNAVIDEDVLHYPEIAEQRSKVYWLLSDFYLEPPTTDKLNALLAHLDQGIDQQQDQSSQLLNDISNILLLSDDRNLLSQQLNIEFTRLFHGLHKESVLPPPYESVYRESNLLGDTTKDVINAYASAGYQDIYTTAGPQDHLGVELRFLSLLCFDESQFWIAGEDSSARASWKQQLNFLVNHVLAWVPSYCDRLMGESVENYYQIVAALTKHVIIHDQEILENLRHS